MFTYDLNSNDDTIKKISWVRLAIGDTKEGEGVRYDLSNFDDDEILTFLEQAGGDVDMAAAFAMLSLANEYASKASSLQFGSLREDLDRRASDLRKMANTKLQHATQKRRYQLYEEEKRTSTGTVTVPLNVWG